MCRASDFAFFDNGGRPIAMAHRGGARTPGNERIENSLAAFETAVRLGYEYVETDVHASADGVAVAFHDNTLDRVTDRSGRIHDLTFERLRQARIGGLEPIPSLAELLDSWPGLHVNIDCKSSTAIGPLVATIADARAWDRVCVASFSARRLALLRTALGPRVATAFAPPSVAALRTLPVAGWRARLCGPGTAAQVPVGVGRLMLVTASFVARAHELGRQVHVWTVDEPAEMRRLLDLGVDGIITDRADVLKDVLVARGDWVV